MFSLLAAHYVFDLGYHPKAKDFFMFLEHLVNITNGAEKECQFPLHHDWYGVIQSQMTYLLTATVKS